MALTITFIVDQIATDSIRNWRHPQLKVLLRHRIQPRSAF
jgi:hypothetical protein